MRSKLIKYAEKISNKLREMDLTKSEHLLKLALIQVHLTGMTEDIVHVVSLFDSLINLGD